MIVVLPEDRDARVARRLVTSALQCLAERLETHRLAFDEPPPGLVRLFLARAWAQRRYDRTTLVRAMATELQRGRIVIAHYDADCAWPGPTKNETEFQSRVVKPVSRLASTERLVAMVPYPCIEAWTYRHLERATTLCRDNGFPTELHDAFAADPLALDTTVGLQEQSPLQKGFNLALVSTGWPRRDARADGQSFAAFVDRLRIVPGLIASLPVP